ncbi:MAG: hypothetical protein ACR2JQ_06060 [Mycobacteriales bacterium]
MSAIWSGSNFGAGGGAVRVGVLRVGSVVRGRVGGGLGGGMLGWLSDAVVVGGIDGRAVVDRVAVG